MEENKKIVKNRRQTMFSIHARIALHSNYGFGTKERSKVLSDYQEIKDRINIAMADEAYRTVLETSPEIDKDFKLKKAVIFGISAHINRNLQYGEDQYYVHLHLAYKFAKKYIYLLPDDEMRHNVLCAMWLHDTIDDCVVTYSDIKKHFNWHIAEIVYLLSNNKGRTRSEKNDPNYYASMVEDQYSVFSKICDRLSNAFSAKTESPSKFQMYVKELEAFESRLYIKSVDFSDMFVELKEILS